MTTHRARPVSEIFFQKPLKQANTEVDQVDQVAEKWLADLEIYQNTLEEMASVNVDKEFKDELNAVQQWFDVLSVGERTAALYALLQDSSQVPIDHLVLFFTELFMLTTTRSKCAFLSRYCREWQRATISLAFCRQPPLNTMATTHLVFAHWLDQPHLDINT